MAMASAIVVLQTTLILSNREPNLWVFSLLQKKKSLPSWGNLSTLFHSPSLLTRDNSTFDAFILPELHSEKGMPLVECVHEGWLQGDPIPDYCRFWYHASQEITSIFEGATWNPHLILLALACLHLLVTFSLAQNQHLLKLHKHNLKGTANDTAAAANRMYSVPLSLCLCILAMLWLITALIAANRSLYAHGDKGTSILDTPTILVAILLLISAAWLVNVHHHYQNSASSSDSSSTTAPQNREVYYHLWIQTFQLQMVSIPLSVLMISVMGVRIYTHIIMHVVLLTVAVNSLWIERQLSLNPEPQAYAYQKNQENTTMTMMLFFCLKSLVMGIPLLSMFMAQSQWGGSNTWQQISVFMAFFSLAPLLIFPMLSVPLSHQMITETAASQYTQSMEEVEPDTRKMWVKLGTICTTAGLGSTVINLALL